MKVAELLFKNGFKEAFAIRGGVRGDKGWLVCLFHSFSLYVNQFSPIAWILVSFHSYICCKWSTFGCVKICVTHPNYK